MRVQVKLFGSEQAAVGRPAVELELPKNARARDVLQLLAKQWPALKGKRLALNHSFAGGDEKIKATDELAIIGMVSGG